MAEKINYKITRGDTNYLYKFRIKDKNENDINLTENDKLYFTLKSQYEDTALIKKKKDNGIILGEDGYYHIILQPEDTEELEIDTYKYDIELDLYQSISDTYFVKTILEGKIKLTEDITRKEDRNNIVEEEEGEENE